MADEAQRDNWAQSDYERGIADIVEERDDIDAMARALAKEAAQRYGQTPDVPPITDALTKGAGNITPLGPSIMGKRFPKGATVADMEMIRDIYDASAGAHRALREFTRRILIFMEAHPEHEYLSSLMVAFGIDPAEFADLLSIGPPDGWEEGEDLDS